MHYVIHSFTWAGPSHMLHAPNYQSHNSSIRNVNAGCYPNISPLRHCSMVGKQIIHSCGIIHNSVRLLCRITDLLVLSIKASPHSHVCRQTTGDYSKYRMLSFLIIQNRLTFTFSRCITMCYLKTYPKDL